jgi:hypothetical protein
MTGTAMSNITFRQHYNGRFYGVLRWHQLDSLWDRVRGQPDGWYVYLVNSDVPAQPATQDSLLRFVREVDTLLRQEHDYDYCGIVYTDSLETPAMIKIFDPNNLGASCGSSGRVIPPRWLLSRIPPEPILDEMPLPGGRKRWWQQVFGR